MSETPVIEITHLHRRYGKLDAVYPLTRIGSETNWAKVSGGTVFYC